MSKSGGGISGYQYYMGLHMGVSRGPVDELVEICVGDRTAWPIGVGDATPSASTVATTPSNVSITIDPITDYEGTPSTSMGYVTIPGTFSTQFAVGKMVSITGTGRVVEVTVYDEFLTPTTYEEHTHANGSYQIQDAWAGHIRIYVTNLERWYKMSGPAVSYDYPTITYTVLAGEVDAGDTADGYPATESKRIFINAPKLFGGDKGEGGIKGPCDIMMGEPTQAVNTDLRNMLGASRLSAFRGVLTLFFDGLITAMNPYPKEWKFRVRRTLKGWADDTVFYSTKCRIEIPYGDSGMVIQAMNPAHIIYECVTNPDWGRGMPTSMINETSFMAAADTLYAEGFGLCLKWVRQETIDVFIQTVIDHIGAALFVSRVTGLLTLKLIRADYDVDTIPSFDMANGALQVLEDQSTSTEPLTNEIIVKYVDPRRGDEAEIRVQNIASIQAFGSIVSDTVEYVGIPTAALASRVASRDLRIKGLPLRRMKFSFDRRAYTLEPGSVFKYVDARRGIGTIVMRVGKADDGLNGESKIDITCVEDVFGLGSSSYVGVPEVISPPSGGVSPALYERMYEASYYDMRLVLPAAGFTDNVGYIVASATRATALHQDFTLTTDDVPADIEDRGSSAFVAGGVLTANLALSDLLMSVAGVRDADLIEIGSSAMINNEILRVDSFNSVTNEVWISRGCADTIPQNHAEGSTVLFYDRIAAVDSTAYTEGDTIYGKIITRSNSGELNPALATLHEVELIGRPGRPYPPANVKVNDVQYGFLMEFDEDMVVTWAHRNKVEQAENLVSHLEASLTRPTGLTYTVTVHDAADDSILRTVSGLTTNTWTYTLEMWATDGAIQQIYLKLISVEDSEESWQPYIMPIEVTAAGWGKRWGFSWGKLG